jgi:hypothetical protein
VTAFFNPLDRRGFRLRVAALSLCLFGLGLAAARAQEPPVSFGSAPSVHLNGESGGKLENDRIAASWQLRDGRLTGLRITDKTNSGKAQPLPSIDLTEPFSLEIQNLGVDRASDLLLRGEPRIERFDPAPDASRFSDRLPGIAVHYLFADRAGILTADWALILRSGSHYIRQQLTVTAIGRPVALTGVVMIDVRSPGILVAGRVKGSPLIVGNFFLGFEQPLSESSVVGDRAVCELHSEVPIGAGQSATYSSVAAIAAPGQIRRAFLTYLERERAHPYRTFLHYNSWFDIGFGKPYTQQEALARIHEIGDELNKKRGVTLDSYLFDDGWDDVNSLWKIRPDFKDGFEPLTKAAAEYGTAPGIWLSPWGGYAEARQERVATAKRDGYEIVDGGLALSGPRYYALFHDAVTQMVTKYGVNQFKFDGTGNVNQVVPGSSFSSDFDAAIHLIDDLRRIKPDLYINLTSGTWPSPFWLLYADSTWRGGDDTEFAGVGTNRERWITYRDAETYNNIVKAGRLYPLSSLMLHGIVFAEQAPGLSTGSDEDFANEVHSYFGTGTQLQELYITPSLLTSADWDVLAEAAKWSRSNAETLKDTHWIGGDPRWLEVYGWAAWSRNKGILTLRNPSARAQEFAVDIVQAFELPQGAPSHYLAHSPWSPHKDSGVELIAGQPHTFHLAPFQVITLEATARP